MQGETLPKDGLARLMLYPDAAVERGGRAQLLLAKSLQLIQALGLNERELRYLLTHAADFGDVALSKLPTRAADDAPDKAVTLFTQFLRLAGYARLQRALAGGLVASRVEQTDVAAPRGSPMADAWLPL